LMASGLPLLWCIYRNQTLVVLWAVCGGLSAQAASLPRRLPMAWRVVWWRMGGYLGAILLAGKKTNSLARFVEPDGTFLA